jgi:hypothetical protein
MSQILSRSKRLTVWVYFCLTKTSSWFTKRIPTFPSRLVAFWKCTGIGRYSDLLGQRTVSLFGRRWTTSIQFVSSNHGCLSSNSRSVIAMERRVKRSLGQAVAYNVIRGLLGQYFLCAEDDFCNPINAMFAFHWLSSRPTDCCCIG